MIEPKRMTIARSPAERAQILKLIDENDSFVNVFREDWTQIVMDDLRNRLYGPIPRNFLLNISGLVGTPTGIFKSSMGLQIAMTLDPFFNLQQRVAFSVNDLLDKLQRNTEFKLCNACLVDFKEKTRASYEIVPSETEVGCQNCENLADVSVLLTKLIFFLDEQTRTLKIGGLSRLQNIVDTCRQRQICFITCGVDSYGTSFKTYELRRVQETGDEYLPRKVVRYAVHDNDRDIYYGYFKWEIWQLDDPRWSAVWKEYSRMKTNFQRIALASQTQDMNLEKYAQMVIEKSEFLKCFTIMRSGKRKFAPKMAKALIFRTFPDMTNSEREMILSQIQMMLADDDDEESGVVANGNGGGHKPVSVIDDDSEDIVF